ncbi:hypothetical protein Tco_0412055 [Tanacetum coccineum]
MGSWVDDQWRWNLGCRSQVTGRVASEFNDLWSKLTMMVLQRHKKDSWSWLGSKDGNYSAKWMREFLDENFVSNKYISPRLSGRRYCLGKCGDSTESVNHAIFSCNNIRIVWESTFRWWGLTYMSGSSFTHLESTCFFKELPSLSNTRSSSAVRMEVESEGEVNTNMRMETRNKVTDFILIRTS